MKERLRFDKVSLTFENVPVLTDMDLCIRSGERIALMGPSGCGKTSLLRLAAGLIKPTKGTITRSTDKIAMQFQEPRLLPTRTAAENVNVVLSDKAASMGEARKWLSRVGLSEAAELYPDELSGGMAQRVALARALAYGGDMLLLDEPFRGLDDALKADIMTMVLTQAPHTAILLVTHDTQEAERFAHRILTLPD